MNKKPRLYKSKTHIKKDTIGKRLNLVAAVVVLLASLVMMTAGSPKASAAGSRFIYVLCSDLNQISYDVTSSLVSQSDACAAAYPGTTSTGSTQAQVQVCDPKVTSDKSIDYRTECGSGDPAVNCNPNLNSNCNFFEQILGLVNIVSGLIGVAVVLNIIVAGIQYSTAADNPNKVQSAKQKVTNSIIALIAYAFLVAFLQWIVPGGVLNG